MTFLVKKLFLVTGDYRLIAGKFKRGQNNELSRGEKQLGLSPNMQTHITLRPFGFAQDKLYRSDPPRDTRIALLGNWFWTDHPE